MTISFDLAHFFNCDNLGNIKDCARLIDKGYVVIFPTDTVYGIGCDPTISDAVLKLFQIKKRPIEKFLPILTSDTNQILKLAEITGQAKVLMNHFWPGQLTLVMKLKEDHNISKYVFNSSTNTVALRIPSHLCTLRLINLTKNKLLVGTSANISGHPPINDVADIDRNALTGYDAVVDGGKMNDSNKVSTIVDVSDSKEYKIIREGVISKEKINDILKIYEY